MRLDGRRSLDYSDVIAVSGYGKDWLNLIVGLSNGLVLRHELEETDATLSQHSK